MKDETIIKLQDLLKKLEGTSHTHFSNAASGLLIHCEAVVRDVINNENEVKRNSIIKVHPEDEYHGGLVI